jgi:hypothetical protein
MGGMISLPLSGEIIISGISAAMQAIQTWLQFRDRHRAAEPLDHIEERASEFQAEGTQLQQLVPTDILFTLQERAEACWSKYKNVLKDTQYLPDEIDDATEAVKACICRELNRLISVNGSIPPGTLRNCYDQYRCTEYKRS